VITVIFGELILVKLSIIIVSYNSKLLLGQCLAFIKIATTAIDHEIIIIDNNSTDGSKEYLPEKFPGSKFIFNKDNAGFAKACNQGFQHSSGKYILFLNPDTILPGNCLVDCLSFLDTHPEAAAAGVRMINGDGKFLKESKRGVPTLSASFYKLFGLSFLFPGSKKFSTYYQSHLPENENNQVEVLSGAFMMIKREVFGKVNGFDERFFMYGEDIDLSLRITQAGYKNYYLGTVTVTHLKGGSTKRNRKYVKDFYRAMSLFVDKHYGKSSLFFRLFVKAGIFFRKQLSIVSLLFHR
jgi:GT2 family glycosyltransferase